MNVRLIPVGRVYDSEAKAREAVNRITGAGYSDRFTSLYTEPKESEEATAKAIVASHEAGDLPLNHAMVYARQVHQGRALLLATPPFSHGSYITGLMDDAGSLELDEPLPAPPSRLDSPSPLSDFLGWPVLLKDEPSPLSTKLGLSPLSHGLTRCSRWFGGPLTKPGWTFSSKIGWRLKSDNPTPLSSMFGLKLLSDNPTPLSSLLGWRLLVDDPAPLSRRVGKKLAEHDIASKVGVSKDGAAEHGAAEEGETSVQGKGDSSAGLPLLIDDPTPLSSKLGLPVLIDKR